MSDQPCDASSEAMTTWLSAYVETAPVCQLLTMLLLVLDAYDTAELEHEHATLAAALKDAIWEVWRVLPAHAQADLIGETLETARFVEACLDRRPSDEEG
jgi:hypothetical protein